MSTIYRIAQEFLRIESIGPRNGVQADRADPLWLHVKVTTPANLEQDVESAMTGPPNIIETPAITVTDRTKKPYRLMTGVWAFDLEPLLFTPGETYVVHWRHSMQPKVMGVTRNTFIWQPTPARPRNTDYAVLYGALMRGGAPVAGARIVIEQYRDHVTLNHRTEQLDVTTDAFGNWWVEVPHGSVQRVIFGETIRTVLVPPLDQVALGDLPEHMPGDGRKDIFGYPLPDSAPQRVPFSSQMTKAPVNPTTSVTILSGEGGQAFEFVQVVPVPVWTIKHPLKVRPTVTVIDTAGNDVIGSVDYPSEDIVVVSFLVPLAGTARLT